MHEIADVGLPNLAIHHYFHLPFDDIKGLGLVVVDMRRWASVRWHHPFQHEVCPVGLCCGCEKRVYIPRSRTIGPVFAALKNDMFYSLQVKEILLCSYPDII